MQIILIAVNEARDIASKQMIEKYTRRIGRYLPFEVTIVEVRKKEPNNRQLLKKEGELLLKKLHRTDHVILLDNRGTMYDSEGFAGFLQKQMNAGIKKLVFVIGGAYGFDEQVSERADGLLSLSKMTFAHQIARVVFLEQLYRGLTILNNEPYHH